MKLKGSEADRAGLWVRRQGGGLEKEKQKLENGKIIQLYA